MRHDDVENENFFQQLTNGWKKLCEGTKGLRRKVWTWTKILGRIRRDFVRILRFVAIYALFEIIGQNQRFLGKKYTNTMV